MINFGCGLLVLGHGVRVERRPFAHLMYYVVYFLLVHSTHAGLVRREDKEVGLARALMGIRVLLRHISKLVLLGS